MSFFLHHKSWVTVEEELRIGDTVILPLGSMEAHGPHKPVGCCYLLAEASSRDVGRRTGIPVTPVIPFGVSYSYKNFPGTMTVSSETLSRYVYEACQGLVRTGFKKIAFFSAHGGENLSVLRELSLKLRDESEVLCTVLHIWGLVSLFAPSGFWEPGQRMGHGGDPTTSVMLYLHPELVDMSRAVSTPLRQPFEGLRTTSYSTHEFKGLPLTVSLFAEEVETSGLMGDPTKASAEKGKILYNKMIDYLAEFMEVFKKLDPSAGKKS